MGNNTSRTYKQYYDSLKDTSKEKHEITEDDMKDVNPYEVLGLSKNFDWDQLKDAYKRIAKLVHPDKGGSEILFNKVTECFRVLAHEYKLRGDDKQHSELKKSSQEYYEQQSERNKKAPITKSSESDDTNLTFRDKFNKAFEENRLDDDESTIGYGHLMAKSSKNREDLSVPVIIEPSKKFSSKVFNKTFESVTIPKTNEIIKFREPEPMPLARKMQYTEIGQTVDDFTSTSEGRDNRSLQYTDYMKAYTTTRLVDPRAVDKRNEYSSVKEYELAREKAMAEGPSDEELQWRKTKEMQDEKSEQIRIQRVTDRDRKISHHHDRMNQMLIGLR